MTYRRGRVSVTITPREHSLAPMTGSAPPWHARMGRSMNRIHVGHARTLLLGGLICDSLGIPYHLRIESCWKAIAIFYEGLIDLMGCVAFLGIRPAKVYPKSTDPLPDEVLRARLADADWEAMKAVQSQFATFECDRWSSIAEDLEWYPNLMIRGMEFVNPKYYIGGDVPSDAGAKAIGEITTFEQAVYNAGGLEWSQFPVPLITEDHGLKMSKSINGIAWDCLKAVSPEDATTYLLATAANPLDPLAAIGETIDVYNLDPTPHEWNWETWGSFIRGA